MVVEGTNDASYISSLFDCEVVQINGDALENINYLKLAGLKTKIYLMTDPDEEGIKIRQKLKTLIPSAIDVELDINKCTKSKKKGVFECEKDEVLRCILNVCDIESTSIKKIKRLYVSKAERDIVCEKLNIEKCNNKTFNQRMQTLQIDEESIKLLTGNK